MAIFVIDIIDTKAYICVCVCVSVIDVTGKEVYNKCVFFHASVNLFLYK